MRAPKPMIVRARELRADMSLPELLAWDHLRGGRLEGLRFRRQHAIGPYVLDFFCAKAQLAVEIDGAHHDYPGQAAADRRRDAWVLGQGILTLRFPATDILDDTAFDGVLATIAHIAGRRLNKSHPTPPPPPAAVPLPRKRGRNQGAADATAAPPLRSGGGGPRSGGGGANLFSPEQATIEISESKDARP